MDANSIIVPQPLNELGAALAKAQAEMHNPAFDSTNPHFRSKFASLAAVRNAVVPVLARHGIAVLQNLSTTERGVVCRNVLIHSSGQSITLDGFEIPATKMDAHGFASAATYARRLSLQAMACVVGDDDDDANTAVDKPAAAEKIPQAVAALRRLLKADMSEDERQEKVYQWHLTMNADQETYIAVSGQLESGEKSALKAYVGATREAKKAKPVQGNGRVAA